MGYLIRNNRTKNRAHLLMDHGDTACGAISAGNLKLENYRHLDSLDNVTHHMCVVCQRVIDTVQGDARPRHRPQRAGRKYGTGRPDAISSPEKPHA